MARARTMLPIIGNVLLNASKRLVQHSNILASSFHILSRPNLTLTHSIPQHNFLIPSSHSLIPSCGFKVKGRVRRRCKDCYMVRREERLYVICKTHPRHKQMSMVKKPKDTWILSHATQSKYRPW
ncbi:hypothetical protein NQ315_013606 [Exocentrus adspersus]|uniref:Ribosomal protein n=1 Tax=Exocentrus adspersus TaxID=1586481 RepID=A0AAV8W497_9CUCU|nr:hypothetical protein NQ315_013606 [Exocentrus adspersus]